MRSRQGGFSAAAAKVSTPATPRSRGAFSSQFSKPGPPKFGLAEPPKKSQPAAPPKPKRVRAPRPPRELTLSEASDLLEDLRTASGKPDFQKRLKELKQQDLGAFAKRGQVSQLLAEHWRLPLKKFGFSIDELGFPEMLVAVRAHAGSAGIRVVAHQVERQLFFLPGALFGLQAVGERSWKRAEVENTVEVTVRHVTEGQEVVISAPQEATMLQVLQILADKVGRPAVVSEGEIVKREDGAFQALPDNQTLCSGVLLFRGTSLMAEAPSTGPTATGPEVSLSRAQELLYALDAVLATEEVQRRMENLAKVGGASAQIGQNNIIREEWEAVLKEFGFPATELGYKSMKLCVKAHGEDDAVRLAAHELERLCRYEPGSYFNIPLKEDELKVQAVEADAPSAEEQPARDSGSQDETVADGHVVIAAQHFHTGKEVSVQVSASGTMLDVKSALVQKLGRGQVEKVCLVRETHQDGTFSQHKDLDPVGDIREVRLLGLELDAPKRAVPCAPPRPGAAAIAGSPDVILVAPAASQEPEESPGSAPTELQPPAERQQGEAANEGVAEEREAAHAPLPVSGSSEETATAAAEQPVCEDPAQAEADVATSPPPSQDIRSDATTVTAEQQTLEATHTAASPDAADIATRESQAPSSVEAPERAEESESTPAASSQLPTSFRPSRPSPPSEGTSPASDGASPAPDGASPASDEACALPTAASGPSTNPAPEESTATAPVEETAAAPATSPKVLAVDTAPARNEQPQQTGGVADSQEQAQGSGQTSSRPCAEVELVVRAVSKHDNRETQITVAVPGTSTLKQAELAVGLRLGFNAEKMKKFTLCKKVQDEYEALDLAMRASDVREVYLRSTKRVKQKGSTEEIDRAVTDGCPNAAAATESLPAADASESPPTANTVEDGAVKVEELERATAAEGERIPEGQVAAESDVQDKDAVRILNSAKAAEGSTETPLEVQGKDGKEEGKEEELQTQTEEKEPQSKELQVTGKESSNVEVVDGDGLKEVKGLKAVGAAEQEVPSAQDEEQTSPAAEKAENKEQPAGDDACEPQLHLEHCATEGDSEKGPERKEEDVKPEEKSGEVDTGGVVPREEDRSSAEAADPAVDNICADPAVEESKQGDSPTAPPLASHSVEVAEVADTDAAATDAATTEMAATAAVCTVSSQVTAVLEAADTAEALLRQPLAYEVVRDDKPVLVRSSPEAQAPELGSLAKGCKVYGFPGMGWLRLHEDEDAVEPSMRGGWVFIGSRLAADFAQVTVGARFAEALDVRWPGLPSLNAAWSLEWRSAGDLCGSSVAQASETKLHKLPAGATMRIRVVGRLFARNSCDIRLCGPWAEAATLAPIHRDLDEDPSTRLDPEGQYRGGCAASGCWGYVAAEGGRCGRCGMPYHEHLYGQESTKDLSSFELTVFSVVCDKAAARAARNATSTVLGVLDKGAIVTGRREGDWLRLSAQSIRDIGQADQVPAAWMLINGARLGLGQLLAPYEPPRPQREVAPTVDVVFRDPNSVEDNEQRLTLPSCLTMLQVKVALVNALGHGSVQKVQLLRAAPEGVQVCQDGERLGGRAELQVLGLRLRERPAREPPGEEAEAERLARRRARREAKRAKLEALEESERRAREELELERRAREEAERLAAEEAERKARKRARREERRAREEAERREQALANGEAVPEDGEERAEEAERLAAEEAERKARKLARREQRKAREEAERLAREEAESLAREEAQREAQEILEQMAKEEAEKARKRVKKDGKGKATRRAKEDASLVEAEAEAAPEDRDAPQSRRVRRGLKAAETASAASTEPGQLEPEERSDDQLFDEDHKGVVSEDARQTAVPSEEEAEVIDLEDSKPSPGDVSAMLGDLLGLMSQEDFGKGMEALRIHRDSKGWNDAMVKRALAKMVSLAWTPAMEKWGFPTTGDGLDAMLAVVKSLQDEPLVHKASREVERCLNLESGALFSLTALCPQPEEKAHDRVAESISEPPAENKMDESPADIAEETLDPGRATDGSLKEEHPDADNPEAAPGKSEEGHVDELLDTTVEFSGDPMKSSDENSGDVKVCADMGSSWSSEGERNENAPEKQEESANVSGEAGAEGKDAQLRLAPEVFHIGGDPYAEANNVMRGVTISEVPSMDAARLLEGKVLDVVQDFAVEPEEEDKDDEVQAVGVPGEGEILDGEREVEDVGEEVEDVEEEVEDVEEEVEDVEDEVEDVDEEEVEDCEGELDEDELEDGEPFFCRFLTESWNADDEDEAEDARAEAEEIYLQMLREEASKPASQHQETAEDQEVEVTITPAGTQMEIRVQVAVNTTMLGVKMAFLQKLKLMGRAGKVQLASSGGEVFRDAAKLGAARSLVAHGLPAPDGKGGWTTKTLGRSAGKSFAGSRPRKSVVVSTEGGDVLDGEEVESVEGSEGEDAAPAPSWPENTPAVIRNRLNINKVAQSELETSTKRVFKAPKQVLKKSWIKGEDDKGSNPSKPTARRTPKNGASAAVSAQQVLAEEVAGPALLGALGLAADSKLEALLDAMGRAALRRAAAAEPLEPEEVGDAADEEGGPPPPEVGAPPPVEVCVQHAVTGDAARCSVSASATMGDVLRALARNLGRRDICSKGRLVRHVGGGGALASFRNAEPLGSRRDLLLLGVDLAVGASLQACSQLVVVVSEAATRWQKRVMEVVLQSLGIGRLVQQGCWLESPPETSAHTISEEDSEGMLWLLGALPIAVPLKEVCTWSVSEQGQNSQPVAEAQADGPEFISIADHLPEPGVEFFIGDPEHEISSASRSTPPSAEETQELLQALQQLLNHERARPLLEEQTEPLDAFSKYCANGFQSLLLSAATHAEDPHIHEAFLCMERLLHLEPGALLDYVEVTIQHDDGNEVVVVPRSATVLQVKETYLERYRALGEVWLSGLDGEMLSEDETLGDQRHFKANGLLSAAG